MLRDVYKVHKDILPPRREDLTYRAHLINLNRLIEGNWKSAQCVQYRNHDHLYTSFIGQLYFK